MKIVIDTDNGSIERHSNGQVDRFPLYSKEAFELISDQWVRVGWNEKYSYTFSWLGVPIIQIPEDMLRTQEVIFRLKPDVIVETGVAHGGSLVFSASLCRLLGRGRVIGVDIEIRPHNRAAIEKHDLAPLIKLIEGDSTAEDTVEQVRKSIAEGDTVMVLLDSCHTKQHVLRELEAYHSLISPGSYIVATDGIMRDLSDVPRGQSDWDVNHPVAAVEEFLASHPEFHLEQPAWTFNESELSRNVTHWPAAWLRRR
ncbi:MAG: cephalosporin hydroxylase family protein [Planctomycetaceae bacterium]|nr:cephalosporin hydroxylase family protein [Planctomycetales bacterium]MCB9873601.1 cephalosporin hydroxylase family protein [Planctomycetaceae bacterium]HRX80438.1 CmcI family methyltransferase [Pirellulaceae bacterium]